MRISKDATWRRVLVAVVLSTLLSGCAQPAQTAIDTVAATPTEARTVSTRTFWEGPGGPLQLDACLPRAADPAPAVILVHGGGFVEGSRTSMRNLCDQLAGAGIAAFSIDYRLAPDFVYPSQVDDLAAAVTWLRKPENVQAFNIDPARIGIVGSSAGAILAQQIATRGQGSTAEGDRVAAVVSLSGVSKMTEEGLALGTPSPASIKMILTYLGCQSAKACPQSVDASPITAVDSTDPPMLLMNSDDEIVPWEQAEAMGAALVGAGVPADVQITSGDRHGIQLLTAQNRKQLLAFLKGNLGLS